MICVSLSNMNYEDCLDRASREAFVEFRFDLLDLTPAQVDEVISTARKSIATYRPDSGDPDRQIQTMLAVTCARHLSLEFIALKKKDCKDCND